MYSHHAVPTHESRDVVSNTHMRRSSGFKAAGQTHPDKLGPPDAGHEGLERQLCDVCEEAESHRVGSHGLRSDKSKAPRCEGDRHASCPLPYAVCTLPHNKQRTRDTPVVPEENRMLLTSSASAMWGEDGPAASPDSRNSDQATSPGLSFT